MLIMNFRKLCFNTFLCLALIFFVVGLLTYVSYKKDMLLLKSIFHAHISPQYSPTFVESATHWVYQNQGFKKNDGFFLLPYLGPTPLQVIEKGGDCADKSRLLMALLESVGIDSSLVMLYGADGKIATHTVLEVRNAQLKAIADPVFDIVFPKSNNGYYGLQELRKNPELLPSRLDELVQLRGNYSKIAFYNRATETYQFATTLNWNKNALLRFIASSLEKMGIEANTVRRPHFLDDPKYFLSVVFFFGSLLLIIFAWLFNKQNNTSQSN
jgi:hypothetical protein